jgi:hypothetical protein
MTSDLRFWPDRVLLGAECGVEASRENIGGVLTKEYGVDEASPLRPITRGSEISIKSSL